MGTLNRAQGSQGHRTTRRVRFCDDRIVATATRSPLVRRPESSSLGPGVAAGLAHHLGIAPGWIRAAFVLTGLLGIGVVAYAAAWALMPGGPANPAPVARFRARDALDIGAYAAIAIGMIDLVRLAGRGIPTWAVVPALLLGIGAVLLVTVTRRNASPVTISAGTAEVLSALRSRPGTVARAVVGGALVLGGATALLLTSRSWVALRQGLFAIIVMLAGLALGFGPWLWRLATDLVDERRARVRNEERAEMAAHLHDSVLQTLAMVQRRADDPREVVRLARRQERELRAWLLAGQPGGDTGTADVPGLQRESMGASLAALAAELEDLHGVPIEIVQVRDRPVDDRGVALLKATREAIVNAQRHSGAPSVSVYCEVGGEGTQVFVRDRGAGFDRGKVGDDRRGISESIERRLARHGGRAEIRSEPGAGTEVMMAMPFADLAQREVEPE